LLAAAALSAGVIASSAQVYSANVVGYVNTVFNPGATLVCNPLKGTTNDLNTIMPSAVDGAYITLFNSVTGDFDATSPTFYANNGVSGPGIWDPNIALNPGTGFFVTTSATFTNTFVGDVMQGNNMPLVVPAGFSLLGSLVPIGGNITNVMAQFPLLTMAPICRLSATPRATSPRHPPSTVLVSGILKSPSKSVRVSTCLTRVLKRLGSDPSPFSDLVQALCALNCSLIKTQ
jgi:hypothetical protein